MEITIDEVKEMMFNLQITNQKLQNQVNALTAEVARLTPKPEDSKPSEEKPNVRTKVK